VISLWHVPESRNPDSGTVDWLGASIATFGLAALIYGFLSSSTLGWTHFRVIASLIFGVGSLILFIFVEKNVKAAANGRNPLAILVPCHRVIGFSGKLAGFAGGLEAKAHLLRLERRNEGLLR
jgi:6-O-methylguanine DNA methyltransferase, DNA binding domain